MKKIIFYLCALICYPPDIHAQEIIQLESVPAPEEIKWERHESQYAVSMINTEIVANVSIPTLTVYRPDPAVSNGTALVIAPGGGFHFLSIINEGSDVAAWCMEHGITAFVLKYRVVPTGENAIMEFSQKMQNRDKMDQEMAPVIALANADGLAAIEYVRSHAGEYGIKTDRIGIMGFSAGGTVAAAAAFEYTSPGNRPDFAAPIYPALHVVDKEKMPADPMPMYIAVTSDDYFGFQTQCTALYDQWNRAGQKIEMHIYQEGGHGFGMRKQNLPSDDWIETFGRWLTSNGF